MERGCPSCGRMIDATSKKCPYCNYDFAELNKIFKHYEDEKEIKIPKYAGFIKRMLANSIDYLLFFVIFTIIEAIYIFFTYPNVFYDFSSLSITSIVILVLPYLLMPIVYFFYCVFMQYSKPMATLGERFVGIEVVDDLEGPLTFGLAFKRNIARILNILTCGIGLLMIIFTKKKQSLSDIVSNTFIINKMSNEVYHGGGYSNLFKRFLAFIIDIVFLGAIYVGFGYVFDYINSFSFELRDFFNDSLYVLMWLIIIFYFPYMDAHGTSFGKHCLKMKIGNINGEKIGFIRALLRFISLLIELILFPFGILLAFVTPRRQTFKDMLTKTIVIDRY